MMRYLLPTILFALVQVTAEAKKFEFPYMGRKFTLIVPEKNLSAKKPLLVLLHGCKQNPDILLEGSRLDQEALSRDFYLLTPQQTIFDNIDRCWNWFMSYQQDRRHSNEMGQIIGAIDLIQSTHKIDKDKTYLTGISAGGVMAHSLAVCYPDYFAGVAIHSGLAYKVAENFYEASTVLTASQLKSPHYLGKKAYQCARTQLRQRKLKRMLLIHGEEDKRVDSFHSTLISQTNEVMLDYVDDGKRNNSLKVQTKHSSIKFPNGYSVRQIDKNYPALNFLERSYFVKGLAHAWGGGKPISQNFDPHAPSSNDFILNFLQL